MDVSDGLKTFCEQKLDHFDSDSTKTWCQRYTTNRTYWKAGGPVFVCIDGEDYPWGGTRKPYTLMCNNMMELPGSEERLKLMLCLLLFFGHPHNFHATVRASWVLKPGVQVVSYTYLGEYFPEAVALNPKP